MDYQFKEIGKEVTIYPQVTLIQPEKMVLKNHIIISEYCYLAAGEGLYIGNFIHLSTQSVISGGGLCVLEDFVGFSAGVRIITGSEDIDGNGLTNPTIPPAYRDFYRSSVRIKKHAFLATNVIVHPGVTIGEGVVVGSGGIVTKDLDPWGIYVGAPLRRIKERRRETILAMEQNLLTSRSIPPSDFSAVGQPAAAEARKVNP